MTQITRSEKEKERSFSLVIFTEQAFLTSKQHWNNRDHDRLSRLLFHPSGREMTNNRRIPLYGNLPDRFSNSAHTDIGDRERILLWRESSVLSWNVFRPRLREPNRVCHRTVLSMLILDGIHRSSSTTQYHHFSHWNHYHLTAFYQAKRRNQWKNWSQRSFVRSSVRMNCRRREKEEEEQYTAHC